MTSSPASHVSHGAGRLSKDGWTKYGMRPLEERDRTPSYAGMDRGLRNFSCAFHIDRSRVS
jgi:hypothetical protein